MRTGDPARGGPFNLAAEPSLTRDLMARVLRATPVHLPWPVLRAAEALAWHARLVPVDPGWLDLAFATPLLDSIRARHELGWSPSVPADAAFAQAVEGMADAAATASPTLRPRAVGDELLAVLRRGPIGRRPLP